MIGFRANPILKGYALMNELGLFTLALGLSHLTLIPPVQFLGSSSTSLKIIRNEHCIKSVTPRHQYPTPEYYCTDRVLNRHFQSSRRHE